MNDGPEGRMKSLDHEYWSGLRKAAAQIQDERTRRLAVSIFEAESVEEATEKVETLRRGTWVDNLILGGSAVVGVFLGYKVQKTIDIRAKGVPVAGLLGLGGIVPGLTMSRTLTARNTLGLGGLLFLAGAGLYTSTNPVVEADDQDEGSEDA